MLIITQDPIEKMDFKSGLTDAGTGAVSTFSGIVRDSSHGKKVIALDYEIFEELAQKEMKKIFDEARGRFTVINAKCIHRFGHLRVGEMAVWIGVAAARRDQAFSACRYIIDELKLRLPIWKKEYYENGDSGWVDCKVETKTMSAPASSRSDESEYYSRQTNLAEVGPQGQEKLKNSRVLVVGAGGLGSSALLYLAASGVGTIGICEFDKLDVSNLHRQVTYSYEDIGKSKIQLAVERLKKLNPFIAVQSHPQKLTPENAETVVRGYDLILDCTDNFPAKFLLNDIAVLNKIPLVVASVYQFDGQLLFYNPKRDSACLRCLWPQIPDASCAGVCTTVGILGVVPGIFGVLQATEAIKYILGLPGVLENEILIFDLTNYRAKKLNHKKDPRCPVCSQAAEITRISAQNYMKEADTDLNLSDLPLEEFRHFEVIDVREPHERSKKPIETFKCVELPFSRFHELHYRFEKDKQYLIFCEKGMRSRHLTMQLREQGINRVFSVADGADALKRYLEKWRA